MSGCYFTHNNLNHQDRHMGRNAVPGQCVTHMRLWIKLLLDYNVRMPLHA